MTITNQVADAIDLVLRARFTAGDVPPWSEGTAIVNAHAIAARRGGCSAQTFEIAGVSSRYVAMALRAGYLRVELDPPESARDSDG